MKPITRPEIGVSICARTHAFHFSLDSRQAAHLEFPQRIRDFVSGASLGALSPSLKKPAFSTFHYCVTHFVFLLFFGIKYFSLGRLRTELSNILLK